MTFTICLNDIRQMIKNRTYHLQMRLSLQYGESNYFNGLYMRLFDVAELIKFVINRRMLIRNQ